MNNIYTTLIREHHLDTLGHVNNATYLQLLEEARWEIFNPRGMNIKKVQELQQGPVILEITIKFLAELQLREQISIDLEMVSFNGKVGQAKQRILKQDGSLSAEALLTFATFDLKARKIITPTPFWVKVWDLDKFLP